MKRGLSYIVMAVFCGLCFSSCAKDELAAKAGFLPIAITRKSAGTSCIVSFGEFFQNG